MKELYKKGIMPIKAELSNRIPPIINNRRILFNDDLTNIKSRAIFFVITSVVILCSIIYTKYSKVEENISIFKKIDISFDQLSTGYKALLLMLVVFAIVGSIGVYKYSNVKSKDNFLFKISRDSISYKENKLYWDNTISHNLDEVSSITLIDIFNCYYSDKSVSSERKAILVFLKNGKVIQDTYHPADQNEIKRQINIVTNEKIKLYCFSKILGLDNLKEQITELL